MAEGGRPPEGILLILSTAGFLGVMNLMAETANVPKDCGIEVRLSTNEASLSFTGTSTTDSL